MHVSFVLDAGPLTEENINQETVENAITQLPHSVSAGVGSVQSQGIQFTLYIDAHESIGSFSLSH